MLSLPPELSDLRRTVLRAPAAAVEESGISPRALERLTAAMGAAMVAAGMSALTAQQVGISLRLGVTAEDALERP